jgi:hypothetical protein
MAVAKSLSKAFGVKSAAVFDASGFRSGKWDQAVKQVAAGLSSGPASGLSSGLGGDEGAESPAYAIVVYDEKSAEGRSSYFAAARTFAKAYTRGLTAISRIQNEILSSGRAGQMKTLEPGDDVRVFVGRPRRKEMEKKMELSPGVYIMPSHLDAGFLADLDLPPLPEILRDIPWVFQVEDSGLQVAEEEDKVLRGLQKAGMEAQAAARVERDTLNWRKTFLAKHPHWTSAQVAEESASQAKNQPATASRWTKEKKVFAIDMQGQKLFPRFQFQDGRPIAAVSQVVKVFPEHASGWDLAYFFTTPNANISGRRPMDLLKEDPSRVVSLAQAFVHPADVF